MYSYYHFMLPENFGNSELRYSILNMLTNIMITKPNRLLQTIFIWERAKTQNGAIILLIHPDIEAEVGLWNKISPTFKQLHTKILIYQTNKIVHRSMLFEFLVFFISFALKMLLKKSCRAYIYTSRKKMCLRTYTNNIQCGYSPLPCNITFSRIKTLLSKSLKDLFSNI